MKLALIGCGAQGLDYAAAAAELGLDLVICADSRAAAAKAAATHTRARATTQCTRIIDIKSIDAVLLCLPAKALAAYLPRAARARKHLLVAPSLPAKPADAQKLLDAARAAGVHLYAAHDSRVAPQHAAIAAQLDARAIGQPGFIRIVRAGTAPRAKIPAGPLTALLPSDLDWLAARFGPKARLFAQSTKAPGLQHAALSLTFANGPIVQWIGACRSDGPAPRASIEICGDGGMIHFTTDDRVLESLPLAGRDQSQSQNSSPVGQSLAARHLARFVARIEAAPAPESYGHDLAVACLLEAALESARSGRETAV